MSRGPAAPSPGVGAWRPELARAEACSGVWVGFIEGQEGLEGG